MVNSMFNLSFRPHDFRVERGDPRLELGDGIRIEILARELACKVAAWTGKAVVGFHDAHSVDPSASAVNKHRGALRRMGKPMPIPAVMRAIDPASAGGPEVLAVVERPVPQPAADEVLIRVAAAGINRPDMLQRMGMYPPPAGAPSIPGLEVAGEVVAVGEDVPHELIGQPMCALLSGGGYAEYAVAPAGQCLPIPHALTMVEAAALPETLFTVWTNLFERGYASEGDTVLVHGGTSGIGTMAISLCGLFGVRVIVTVGSDEKCAAAKALGADVAINYRTDDFVERVAAETGGRGCAVVLDMVGGDYVARNLKCLADDGRHVSIAVQGGAMATIPVFEVMRRRLTLTGSTLRPRDAGFKAMVADELSRTVWPHVEAGKLKPVIDRTYTLADAAEAHRRMESGEHVGKLVLTIDQRNSRASQG
jgi:putative PIG3 family NAD(P)H quinone oxidoreductase